jgi:tetratricopeptide (TPR) repeat protein
MNGYIESVDREAIPELVEIARSAIAREIQARDWQFDASQVQLLRPPEPHDLDQDGRDEYCFVAGIPTYGGPAMCGLCVPLETGGYNVRALHEFEAGFRDLFVSDVNKDRVPEVVTVWQEEFGLILSVHVQQWGGGGVRSLFPDARFHQGLMELRDLDADGIDEIIVWSGRYESNPRWGLQYFDIYVFRYDGNAYTLWQTRRSDRRYLPEGLLGQRIGIGGIPIEYERPPSPTEQRRRLGEHIEANDSADPVFLEQIGGQALNAYTEGFYDEALETVEIVFEGIEHVADPDARLVLSYEAWVARATTYLWVGRYQEAIDAYQRAIELYDGGASARIDPQHGATRRRELALVHYRVGEYAEALRWLSDAEAVLNATTLPQNNYRDELGRIRSASGLAHAELGEYERAKSDFREAIDLHEGLDRFTQAALSRTSLGNTLREEAEITEGGYAEAIRSYEQALHTLDRLFEGDLQNLRFSDTQDFRDRESDVYLELGRTLLLDRKFGAALRTLKKSLLFTTAANLAHHAAVHYLYIGEGYAGLSRVHLAERFFGKAIEFADRYGTPETRWRALHKLALVRRDDGRLSECVSTLSTCIETIERLRSQYLPEATKISMLSSKEKPYEDIIVLLCQALSDRADNGDSEQLKEAFNYVERVKSRVFTERLAGTELGTAGLPRDLVEGEQELVRDLRRLQARYRAEAAPLRYDWGAEAAQIEDDLESIREDISRSGPRGREYVALRQALPIDYGGTRELLDRIGSAARSTQTGSAEPVHVGRIVLAEYFTYEDGVFLFIGRSDLHTPVVHRIDVPRNNLWEWRRLVFEDMTGPADWDLGEWQDELGRLVQPIGNWSEENDIIWFVPHGDLHSLPLHALKIHGRYLIERNPVFYAPSASVMRYCETKGSGRKEAALVVGDSLEDSAPLAHARQEARTVAPLFGTEPILGNRATKSVVTNSIVESDGSIDVFHFACHGKFEFAEPLESCIMLAPLRPDSSRRAQCVSEWDLTAGQILQLEMRAELVTLSACESGVSKRHPGDELIGLSRSLIYAGTPSVLATLWSVNDRSTAQFMERFYGDWLEEAAPLMPAKTKARALQEAQRYVMNRVGYDHPYYWAPFVLVGDWR